MNARFARLALVGCALVLPLSAASVLASGLFINHTTNYHDTPAVARSIAVGDFDGDGNLDVATEFGGAPRAPLLIHGGPFGQLNGASDLPGASGGAIATVDLDGDDDLDLVTGNQVLMNDGAGVFTRQALPIAGGRIGIPEAIDGEQGFCVGVMTHSDPFTVHSYVHTFQMVEGAVTPANVIDLGGVYIYGVAAGDFDDNGMWDVAAATYHNSSGSAEVLVAYQDVSGFTQVHIPMPRRATALKVGDLNHDGRPDLVVGMDGGIAVLKSGFLLTTYLDPSNHVSEVAVGDVDRDGKRDVVATMHEFNFKVFPGNGSGALGAADSYTLNSNANDVFLADMDRDGPIDALFARGSRVEVYRNRTQVAAVGAESGLSLAIDRIAPNPARESATLFYRVPAAGRAGIEIFDVSGRRVSALRHVDVGAGRHSQALPIRGLAAGIYVIRLTHENRSVDVRACIVR